MKIELFIVQYLYNNKSVSIPEIGVFTITGDAVLPDEKNKEQDLPPDVIQFDYNPKAVLDEGLIDFVVAETRKVRSLAISDLESYINLSRQFLNIGKPLVIEGLGTIIKNQEGTYEFTQATIANPKMEPIKADIKEKIQSVISFSSPAKQAPNKQAWFVGLILLIVIITVSALYYFLLYNDEPTPIDNTSTTDTEISAADTSQLAASGLQQTTTDSLTANSNSVSHNSTDGFTFKVQIKQYDNRDAATRAYNRLTSYGHQLLFQQKDSTTFQVLMPFSTALSDTARAKDSVRIMFGGNPVIVQ
jgi:hypothetical protein